MKWASFRESHALLPLQAIYTDFTYDCVCCICVCVDCSTLGLPLAVYLTQYIYYPSDDMSVQTYEEQFSSHCLRYDNTTVVS